MSSNPINSGPLNIINTNPSVSTTTGALTIQGGASIVKVLTVGESFIGRPQNAFIADIKTQGTNGGAAPANATTIRTLNTIISNSIPNLSLTNGTTGTDGTANQFILPSGIFLIEVRAPAWGVNEHKISLFNVTTSLTAAVGTSELSNSTNPSQTWSEILTIITTTGSTYQINHYTKSARATVNGFGVTTFPVVGPDMYTTVFITRLG
jgi:hypothetical protein